MQVGIENYNDEYFLERHKLLEVKAYHDGVIRAGDMGACVCYSIGALNYQEVRKIINIPEPHHMSEGLLFHGQVEAIRASMVRIPKQVLSIGCGRGEMEAALYLLNIPFVAVDPSPSIPRIFKETMEKWAGCKSYNLINAGCAESISLLNNLSQPDTIIFCESIEHIPEEEFNLFWKTFAVPCLRATHGRFIACNWIFKHPIRQDKTGWDHVRSIDDGVYDDLCRYASEIVYREGSHLVLGF